MKDSSHLCPCGSGRPFQDCCEPVIADRSGISPSTLMRSRYTAYVLKNEEYLLTSWAPSTRPGSLDLQNDSVTWLGLEVLSENMGQDNEHGEVTFEACFLDGDELCRMHETSRFILHNGLWHYLDGDNTFTRERIARNGLCPCGSGRKFKRCCLIK